jgi:hypothetical protein
LPDTRRERRATDRSSVQDWCDTCADYRTGEILERNAEPPADRFGDVQVVRTACPECGGDLFALDPNEAVTTLFEVRPGKHALSEETSHFIVVGTRGEVDALERDLGENHWVGTRDVSLLSPAEARSEYDSFLGSDGEDGEGEES